MEIDQVFEELLAWRRMEALSVQNQYQGQYGVIGSSKNKDWTSPLTPPLPPSSLAGIGTPVVTGRGQQLLQQQQQLQQQAQLQQQQPEQQHPLQPAQQPQPQPQPQLLVNATSSQPRGKRMIRPRKEDEINQRELDVVDVNLDVDEDIVDFDVVAEHDINIDLNGGSSDSDFDVIDGRMPPLPPMEMPQPRYYYQNQLAHHQQQHAQQNRQQQQQQQQQEQSTSNPGKVVDGTAAKIMAAATATGVGKFAYGSTTYNNNLLYCAPSPADDLTSPTIAEMHFGVPPPSAIDEIDEAMVKRIAKRLEAELRAAKAQYLGCTEVSLPLDLTTRIATDILKTSEREPCGVRGCSIFIEFEDEPKNTRRIASFKVDPDTVSTFELYLTLKEDLSGWLSMISKFIKNLTRNSTIVISHDFNLTKNKLYSCE